MIGRTCGGYGGEYKCKQHFNGESGRHNCRCEDNINVYPKEVDEMA